jgi:hypothetical protein
MGETELISALMKGFLRMFLEFELKQLQNYVKYEKPVFVLCAMVHITCQKALIQNPER